MTSHKTPAGRSPVSESPRSLRILLAEDDKLNQHLVKRLLAKQGHEVVAVGDGRQAVAAVQSHQLDVVVMDLDMPVMNGLEAIRIIRDQSARHVPIIALTSFVRHTLEDESWVRLVDIYLTKPVNAAELLRAIDEVASAGDFT